MAREPEARSDDARDPGALGLPATMWIAVLILARVVVVAAALVKLGAGPVEDDDVLRFHALAQHGGMPWRDYDVEYAPVEAVLILAVGQGTVQDTGRAVVLLAFVADLGAAAAIWVGWGRRAAARYLAVGLPLLSFISFRLDAIPIALAMLGFVLARRGWPLGGGASLATAMLTKVWPVVTLPALVLEGRRRAVAWAAGIAAAGVAVWVAVAGVDAPVQVATFRGAPGWSIESVIGTVVWIVTGAEPRLAGGAPRVGTIPGAVRAILAIGLLVTLIAVWTRARRRPTDPLGGAALVAVAALLIWSPLLSLQYALWLTPFVAIAAGEPADRAGAGLGVAAVVGTGLVRVVAASTSVAVLEQAILLLRNVSLVAIVVWWFVVTRDRALATG